MDGEFPQEFQGMQDLIQYCQNGNFEDMPLSNEVLNGFYLGSYQIPAPGGLPSPNSSNPDLAASGQQSPRLSYDFQQMDGSSSTRNDFLGLHLPQKSQELGTDTEVDTSNSHMDTNHAIANASSSGSESDALWGEHSLTSSSHTNAGQCQSFTVPSDGSLCVPYQPSVSSDSSTKQIASNWTTTPTPTHVAIGPRVVNNTSSASAPANPHCSPSTKPQHIVRYPSHLRHQIHPELLQCSPLTVTATEDNDSGQSAYTMSSSSDFTNRQQSNVSPSYGNYQNKHHALSGPYSRRITGAHNQSRGSPILQNHQPFQESSLRSPVTSHSGEHFYEAGQFEIPLYPDPQPVSQQQSSRIPYLGHQRISETQKDCMNSYSSAQYLMQSRNSGNASFMGQGLADFEFNGSSPTSLKRELFSPESDHLVSTPIIRSQVNSPKSQKKRRAKHGLKNSDDNEPAIDPTALQTTDLTNLDPTDQTSVASLIHAMHNTDNVEDNQGMQKTWEKVRKAKALRIKEVCVELLNLTKQAQQNKGTPLGEKRPINYYASFQKRFDALHETLMFQKTVCKHLIEPPYSYSVVDDPENARDRVKNNRRVNHQKAEAIRLGREHLGEKGQGKGRPMLKTKKRALAQLEDDQDDEENSGDEALSDVETDGKPQLLGPKSGCLAARTPKRTKRSSNSTQHQDYRTSMQAPYSPRSQSWEDPFAQAVYQNAQSPNQQWPMASEHDCALSELIANQKMPTLNQGYDFQPASESRTGYYGDNSTAGSDSEGLGAIGCAYK